MASRQLDDFRQQTRDITMEYLRESGLFNEEYFRIVNEKPRSLSREECHKIAEALRKAEDMFEDVTKEKISELPKNSTLDDIIQFLKEGYCCDGEINWERIASTVITIGGVVSKLRMGDADAFQLVTKFALMTTEPIAVWVDNRGGWSAIVDYIDNVSPAAKVGLGIAAAGALAAIGYGLLKAFSSSKRE